MGDDGDSPTFSIQFDGDENTRAYIHKDGKATATFPNNDTYTGQYKNMKKHGNGQYSFLSLNETSAYTGEYLDGARSGQGKLIYPDNSVYEGQWLNNERSGEGIYVYSNGDQYIGQWLNDKRHGHGRYIYASDRTEFSGEYNNGECLNGQWEMYAGKLYKANINNGKIIGYA